MSYFYKIARKANHVRRLHTVRVIHEETVGEHTANIIAAVMEFTHFKPSANLLMSAAMHDLAEVYTGDVPANVKKEYPAVKEALDRAESDWLKRMEFPNIFLKLTNEERLILKFCDAFDLLQKCLIETAMGNSTILPITKRINGYVMQIVDAMDDNNRKTAQSWMLALNEDLI